MRAFLLLHRFLSGETVRVCADHIVSYETEGETANAGCTKVMLDDYYNRRCMYVRETPEDIDSMMRAAGIGIMTIMKEHMKEEEQNAEGNHVQ